MASGSGSPHVATLRRVMIFIDGGYLRKYFKDAYQSDAINFALLRDELTKLTFTVDMRPELKRVYYFDANVDITGPTKRSKEDLSKHREISEYMSRVKQNDFYQVKLGRLTRTDGSYRQKGVDVLLAIEMMRTAYHNQYETAVVLAGDDDLVDAVEGVKELGGTVYGVYFEGHCSERLRDSFDVRVPVPSERLGGLERFLDRPPDRRSPRRQRARR